MTTCTLCDLPAEGVTAAGVDGTFCCRGCLEVYRTLGDVDPAAASEDSPSPTDSLSVPDDAATAYLAVTGMHCSTCELFLEDTAAGLSGVYSAEASYAAEAIKVVYDPDSLAREDIASAVSGLGYRARLREDTDVSNSLESDGTDMASRLLVGGLFGMMAMTWYALFLYPTYFGYDPIVTMGRFDSLYLYGQIAVVTAIVLLYTGRPMLRGAYVSLRTGRPNVDLLVTIAALAAFLYSTGRLLQGGSDLYYDVTIVVVLAVTVGTYYERRIKRTTAGLLTDLTELQVDEATRRNGDAVAVEDIEAGAKLLVRPGERVPVDGTVRDGVAAVDEALVTGESRPTTKRPGDEVRGGTVVTDGPLVVAAGAETESTLDRVVDLLWDIQASRPGAQRIADRLALVFVPLVLLIAGLVGLLLVATGSSVQTAVLAGLTVLIVSCPCALGLATPLAVASGLQTAARRGVVVTTPALFEHGGEVDTVVFDKTGTLTDGEMAVTGIETDGAPAETVLARAGALEQYSEHPVAGAIVAAVSVEKSGQHDAIRTDATGPSTDGGESAGAGDGATREQEQATRERLGGKQRDATVGRPNGEQRDGVLDSFERYPRGVAGTVDGHRVVVGHPDFVEKEGHTLPDCLAAAVTEGRTRGETVVAVGWDGRVEGVLTVGDRLRPGWEGVLETVGSDRETVVLTGDAGPAADRFRASPAVDQVFAGVPPDGKAATVRRLAATGTVAMVGDGSNDAPALAAADLGIALESGTRLATDAADAVVLESNLWRLPAVFAVAGATGRRIRENLAWAFVYNGVAIPLAVAGLLNPLFAALAMAGSSLLVVANSARGSAGKDGLSDGTVGDTRSAGERTAVPPKPTGD